MKKIEIDKGRDYYYNEIPLYLGRKKINKNIAKKNLKLLKQILDENKIKFGIIFGTLLGAVRDNNFIEHDEDTDIFIFKKNEKELLNLLPTFEKNGFKIARYDKRGELSIIKDNEYIDFYILEEKKDKLVCCNFELNHNFFKELDQIKFIDEVFLAPREYEKWLEEWYGKEWRIPKIRKLTKKQILKGKLRSYLKKIIPEFFKDIFYKNKKIITKDIF